MPDLDTPLDRSIRQLVARAIADAPAPPEIGPHTTARASTTRTGAARWVVTGLAGVSVAAALTALFFVARPDEVSDPPLVPATRPDGTTPASTPATTIASVVTTPDTSGSNSGSVVPTSPGGTTEGPTTTALIDAEGVRTQVVVAGPDGVTVFGLDGAASAVTNEPMAVAVPAPDGRVFLQREDARTDPSADTTIFVVAPDTTELVGIPDPAAFAGAPKVLHAAANVNGELTLLVETRTESCPSPDACDGSLWAFRPDSGEADQLATKNMWEGAWSDLSLSSTGVVVGDDFESATVAPFSVVVPGGSGTAINFATLGLESSYFDCSTCPTSFRIDPTGRFVGWIEHDAMTGTTVAVARLEDAAVVRTGLIGETGARCCASSDGPLIPVLPSLALDNLAIDGASDTISGNVVINETDPTSGREPLVIGLEAGVTTTGIVGTTVRFG
jgi:hypothetical protein